MKSAARATAEGILFTDQYQLTMAQLYFRMGMHERHAQFDHFYRSNPNYGSHQAGYCISAGLEWLLDWMEETRIRNEDIELMRTQKGQTGDLIFEDDFLHWLRHNGTFEGINMRAIPEGRVVHPNVPLTVVEGPLAIAQILETPLLNQLNYQTLIATKASRVCQAGRGQPVLEFGTRRAHERGANAGVRAALIGGANFSSNVGISHVLGLPPKGTHAHSMVQIFMALDHDELSAFRAYADVYPNDCLLLVDTVNTLESGVPNAIKVFEELRRKGHQPVGIRLDSGDLAHLSVMAARMLNDAGFPDTFIVLSNKLDELAILQILQQIELEAPSYGVDADQLIRRLVYGVGTRMITSHGHSALGGVYKLVAVQDKGNWKPAIKISESAAKVPNPGNKRIWRIYDQRGMATADLLDLVEESPQTMQSLVLCHPVEHGTRRMLKQSEISEMELLLVDVLRGGRPVYEPPALQEIRQRRESDLARLDPGIRRLVNPHIYHVSLTERLWALKQELISTAT